MPLTGALTITLLLVATAGAQAESFPHERTGFCVGAGLGIGGATQRLAGGVVEQTDDSGTANLRVGWALREYLVAGVEATAWTKDYRVETLGHVRTRLYTVAGTFAAHPWNVGAYVRGGVGIAIADVRIDSNAEETTDGRRVDGRDTDFGFGVFAAGGYEFRLSHRFAVGPQIEVSWASLDGAIFDTYWVLGGSAQFNWYW